MNRARGSRESIAPLEALKRIFVMIALGVCVCGAARVQAQPAQSVDGVPLQQVRERVSPWVLDKLGAGGAIEMLIVLEQGPDLSRAESLVDRSEKGRFVYDSLRGHALASQHELVNRLRARGLEVTQFWVVNAILVRGDLALAYELASDPRVVRVVGNPLVKGVEELPESEAEETLDPGERLQDAGPACYALDRFERITRLRLRAWTALPGLAGGGGSVSSLTLTPQTIECGVSAVKAPNVWTDHGVRGEGIVVASMDTGVEWTHPAIQQKYRGWNNGTPDHRYSWHDAIDHTTVPLDDNNHGTHTTGTMVGDDLGVNQIGVAPGAQWVACRNMDHGNGTPARYLECVQWGLAPYPEGSNPLTDGRPDLAPDITNNSWACPPVEGCDALTLKDAFENVRLAGQMTVAAVGNSGSSCSSANNPLGIYDAAFSTAAVTCSGGAPVNLASFSSRGPVTVDGSGRRKPDIAAPGSSVRSSIRMGQYALSGGTSMASPHVAGAFALFWSARPQFKHLIRISRCYMERSAGPVGCPAPPATCSMQNCGGTGPADKPNNLWGWGSVDALAAINLVTTGPDGDGDGVIDPCDCAAGDGSSFDGPPEVSGDAFVDRETFVWSSQAPIAGPGTVYDVARGTVSQLRADGGFAGAVCESAGQLAVTHSDSELPAAGDVFYYIVRARNSCGIGTYGTGSNGLARTITACP